MKLNNLSLKTKFILLFLCCVLLPIGCLNMVVYYYACKNIENDRAINAHTAALQIEDYYEQAFASADNILQYMYSFEDMYSFFRQQYKNGAEYYKSYLQFNEEAQISYTMAANDITGLTFCTGNDTVVEGGYCMSINSVKDEIWYRAFVEDGGSEFVYADTDTISLVQRMDYYAALPELILKVDINRDRLISYISKSKMNYDIYLYDGDTPILSNTTLPADKSKLGGSVTDISVLNRSWQLVLVPDYSFQILGMDGDPWIVLVMALNLILPVIVLLIIEKSMTQRLIYFRHEIDRQEVIEQESGDSGKYSLQPLQGDFGSDEIGKLINHHNRMVERIQLLMNAIIQKNKEKSALELSRKQAELNALLSQVNPHFIYNTLESICMKSLIKGETETCEMIRNVSLLLREMSSWKEDNKRLAEEIAFAKKYLELQKYRFGDKLSYEIKLDEDCENYLIPKMTITTFAENACVHGICDSYNDGIICIEAHKRGDSVFICIRDTGNGFSEEKLAEMRKTLSEARVELLYAKGETGILNAYLRLKMYFGERLDFSIESTESTGTAINILIKNPDLYSDKEELC